MRRYPRQRIPKKYVWNTEIASGQASMTTVLNHFLVTGTDFNPTGAPGSTRIDRVMNVQRILVDLTVSLPPELLNDVTDTYIMGCLKWMVIIVDENDLTVYDPDASNWVDEKVLAYGFTDPIGCIIDVNAQAAGTGISSTFGHNLPFATHVKLDIATNRRMSNDEICMLCMTRDADALTSQTDVSYGIDIVSRTLVKLP